MTTPVYRVKDWDEKFESHVSRNYGIKSQTYHPNKCGEGYWRLIDGSNPRYTAFPSHEFIGVAVYGAWIAMINLLSRKQAPRNGYLTDDGQMHGTPLTPEGISLQTGVHVVLIKLMLEICSSKEVGWIVLTEVKSGTPSLTSTADGIVHEHCPNQTKPNQSNPNPTIVRPAAHGDAVKENAPATPADNNGDFDTFWKAYPRKVGKTAAHNVWKKLKPRPPLEKILAAIKAQAATDQWQRDGGQYIPHPTTWLRQGRYDDEAAPSVQSYRSKI
jgi:hypothetical protein